MKKKENKRCYYGHSMKIYDTLQEQKELNFLNSKYSKVLNPNHDIGEASKGMQTYLNIVKWSDVIVISEYQGYIGKGVFAEIQTAIENKIEILVLKPHGTTYKLHKVTDIELTRDSISWVKYAVVKHGKSTVN